MLQPDSDPVAAATITSQFFKNSLINDWPCILKLDYYRCRLINVKIKFKRKNKNRLTCFRQKQYIYLKAQCKQFIG